MKKVNEIASLNRSSKIRIDINLPFRIIDKEEYTTDDDKVNVELIHEELAHELLPEEDPEWEQILNYGFDQYIYGAYYIGEAMKSVSASDVLVDDDSVSQTLTIEFGNLDIEDSLEDIRASVVSYLIDHKDGVEGLDFGSLDQINKGVSIELLYDSADESYFSELDIDKNDQEFANKKRKDPDEDEVVDEPEGTGEHGTIYSYGVEDEDQKNIKYVKMISHDDGSKSYFKYDSQSDRYEHDINKKQYDRFVDKVFGKADDDHKFYYEEEF